MKWNKMYHCVEPGKNDNYPEEGQDIMITDGIQRIFGYVSFDEDGSWFVPTSNINKGKNSIDTREFTHWHSVLDLPRKGE